MKKTTLMILNSLIIIFLIALLAGCGGGSGSSGGDGGGDTTPSTSVITEDGRISGTVLDEDNSPLGGVQLSLFYSLPERNRSESELFEGGKTTTGEDGTFIFRNLSKGYIYEIRFEKEGRKTVILTYDAVNNNAGVSFDIVSPEGDGVISFTLPTPLVLQNPVVTESSVALRWNASANASFSSYKVYRAENSDVTTGSTLLTSIDTKSTITYTDTIPDTSNVYFYRIYEKITIAEGVFLYTGSNVVSSSALPAWTTLRQAGTGMDIDIENISFVSETKGWVCGYKYDDNGMYSKIYHTSNAGSTWTEQFAVYNAYIYGIKFTDENNGWAIVEGNDVQNRIIHTSDGGNTWKIRNPQLEDFSLYDYNFIDANNAWILCCSFEETILYKTTDAGVNWTVCEIPEDTTLNVIQFISPTNGWIITSSNSVFGTAESKSLLTSAYNKTRKILGVRSNIRRNTRLDKQRTISDYISNREERNTRFMDGALYYTSNGGETWTKKRDLSVNLNLQRMCFKDSNNGWAISHVFFSDDLILRTTDGGETWTTLHTLEPGLHVWHLEMLNSNTGWIFGSIYSEETSNYSDVFLRTVDGGVNWTKIDIDNKYDLWTYSYISATKGWLAGSQGTVLATTNGGVDWTEVVTAPRDLFSIYFADSNTGWAAGAGVILKTTNGGTTWTQQFRNDSLYFEKIQALSSEKVVALSQSCSGGLYYSINGGTNWEKADFPEEVHWIGDFAFVNANYGWLTHGEGIAYTVNGGEAWDNTQVENCSVEKLAFIDKDKGWAVGEEYEYEDLDYNYTGNYLFLNTTDGGVTWNEISATPLAPDAECSWIHKMQFTDQNKGWLILAVYQNNTYPDFRVYNTTDGGVTWNVVSKLPQGITNIHFISPNRGWAVGLGGKIFATTDGGTTWRQHKSGSGAFLAGLFFHDQNTGWTTGKNGLILKSPGN
jgi:photosystem II stability/assembly factor-like uncharacterized protein